KYSRRDQIRLTMHPRVFYGWIVVAVAFVTLLVSLGIRFTYSIFFVPLTREFGWDRASTSSIFSISLLLFAAVGPFLGNLLDRVGARVVFVIGSVILGAGLILTSTSQSLWQMIVYYSLIASMGLAALALGMHGVVLSRWFIRRRGLAIGLAFAGTGIGTFIFSPLVERLITIYGWRGAYLALGVIVLVLLVPINAIWARTRPQEMNALPDGDTIMVEPRAHAATQPTHTARSALRDPRLWLLLATTFLALTSARLILVHAVAHMVDVGFAPLFAATVFGAVGAVQAPATVAWGWISDRVGRVWAFAFGSLAVVAAIALLLLIEGNPEPTLAWMFAIAFGVGDSSRTSLINALTADLFEGPAFGTINGYNITAFGLGGALGPWLGGYLFDTTGHYTIAFWFALIATFVATLGVLAIGRRGKSAFPAKT
ncbi:MAG: MFS transporter, partial [Chloroflexota bacterium]|nr:MFS transporter [Chloroflexota bacterium]